MRIMVMRKLLRDETLLISSWEISGDAGLIDLIWFSRERLRSSGEVWKGIGVIASSSKVLAIVVSAILRYILV